MLTVVIDVKITRRKRYHIVMDGPGKQVFKSMHFGDVIAWLDEEGVEEYHLQTETHSKLVRVTDTDYILED